jgi:hypothetical protein
MRHQDYRGHIIKTIVKPMGKTHSRCYFQIDRGPERAVSGRFFRIEDGTAVPHVAAFGAAKAEIDRWGMPRRAAGH